MLPLFSRGGYSFDARALPMNPPKSLPISLFVKHKPRRVNNLEFRHRIFDAKDAFQLEFDLIEVLIIDSLNLHPLDLRVLILHLLLVQFSLVLENFLDELSRLEIGEFSLAIALEDIGQLFDRVVLIVLIRERLQDLHVLVLQHPVLLSAAAADALLLDLVNFMLQVLSKLLELLLDSFCLRGLPGAQISAFRVD